ncbi:hypothetical protein Sango_1295300 [Sesamum angolense]|uniref:Retrotransposon gag domain-containing protein n=1 Tax=Sesamum angolense TaxID=2727404 RepID=A0AAE1WRB8_9LAMI|nr:hypothetical protein Sango_1295300 [Sesamum angolense]
MALKTDIKLVQKAVASVGTEVARVPAVEKGSITSMNLTRDIKLWWHSRLSDDASANRKRIETWEVLKELKDQFLPCNTSWVARESLRNLRHTGRIHKFVKEFSSIMLDVRDMSEEDKPFNFMVGLKPWAQTELRRQGVKDLLSAIAAADRLADFKVVNDPEQRNDHSGKGNAKFEKLRADCFIYGNLEHRARNCRKHDRLNAIVAEQIDVERGTKLARMVAMQLEAGLDVKPWDSQVKAVNSKVVPVIGIANRELCVGSWSGHCNFIVGLGDFDAILGRNKAIFVKGGYDGCTTAGKKSEMIEVRPSNASSSNRGTHSPRLASFSCIRKMQEEMHRRWTKAQQICVDSRVGILTVFVMGSRH